MSRSICEEDRVSDGIRPERVLAAWLANAALRLA